MNRIPARLGIVAVCVLLGATTEALAGKFNRVLDVGDKAPAWKDLRGTDDNEHSLADLRKAKAVVVVFSCNHCPVAQSYEERLIAFQKEYKDKGVTLVAINVNNTPADRLDKMKERAEKRGFNFTYLYDPSQEIARKFGATCTPHAFLLDGDRKIAYMGKIDDSPLDPTRVTKPYLRKAVDAVLAGKTPEIQETFQTGCGIQYE